MDSTQNLPNPSRVATILKRIPPRSSLTKFVPALVVLVILAAGVGTGLVVSSRQKSAKLAASGAGGEQLTEEVKESFAQTFRDQTEGTVTRNDDLDKYAQGTHKLIRPGGESQTAYLTSSVLDLDQYLGKKVKVFGETFGSSQVGWLMDVGKVEVIE